MRESLALQRSPSLDAFLAEPVGCFFSSLHFFVWCRDTRTCGSVTFGQIDRAEMEQLVRALDFASHPRMQGYAVLADMRRLLIVDPTPFLLLSAYVDKNSAWLARKIARQSVLLPRDPFTALVVRGYFENLNVPSQCFADAAAACASIDETAALTVMLDDIYNSLTATSLAMRALRQFLQTHYATATLVLAARSLGVSPRSLQRSLVELGSQFGEELRRTRLGEAARLLSRSDLKVSAVASTVGYASAAHFGELFKARYGMTPAQFRAANATEITNQPAG